MKVKEQLRKKHSRSTTWQLQEAKNKLSEVLHRSQTEGPQIITLHGQPAGVLVSFQEFQNFKAPKDDLLSFLNSLPMKGVNLELERDRTPDREVNL